MSVDTVSSQVTTEQGERPRKWTVMVFMGADNLPGEAPLAEEAEKDLAEMRATMKPDPERPNPNDNLNIFVQLHVKGSATREHIDHTRETKVFPVSQDEQNPTDGTALTKFISWAVKTARHSANDYSMLVLWGHAYRFGIGHRATREGTDALDFAELADVLGRFQEVHRRAYGGADAPKLEIVGFDACDLATIEMAYQLHPFAEYMLASQIAIPLPGWPYDRILHRIRHPEGRRVMGPAEFGTYIVRRFCEAYKAQNETDKAKTRIVSLTLLDLKQAEELNKLADGLANKLAIALCTDPREQALVEDLFRRSQTSEGKPFVDVADLCLNLMRHCSDPGVGQAAQRLGDFLLSPKPVEEGESRTGKGRPFIVEHGRNASQTAKLHGVSLYAPHVAPAHDPSAASHFYEKFVFAKKTLWNELVRGLALPS